MARKNNNTARWVRVDAHTGEVLTAPMVWEDARVSAYRVDAGRITRLVKVV
jgi:hypothetical protein